MAVLIPLVAATGLFVLWYVLSSIKAWYRLRHIPGPFFARFSYLWSAYNLVWSSDARGRLRKLQKKYGTIVRVGPNQIITSDPEMIRSVNSARSKYPRDEWCKGSRFHPEYDNVFTMINIDEHDRFKAKTASGYSGREHGASLEPTIDVEVAKFINLIRRKFVSTPDKLCVVDISEIIRYVTMDIITGLAYGKSFGHLDEGVDIFNWIGHTGAHLIKSISLFMELPLLRRIVFSPLGLKLIGAKETDESGPGKIMGVAQKLINERFQPDAKPRNDMIGAFVRNGMTQQEIEGEAMLQLFAGSDTTTNVLSVTMVHLVSTPHAYLRLKREISDAMANGTVTLSREGVIPNEQASKLPYLRAVLNEGLRVSCPANFGHYKNVPKGSGGETFHGFFLPEGTAVGNNYVAVFWDKEIFGQDADAFRPERFSDVDEETRSRRAKVLDIVFGGGRWMCSGKMIAAIEMNKVLFELVRAFDIQMFEPQFGWDEFHYIGPKFERMMVRITEAEKAK